MARQRMEVLSGSDSLAPGPADQLARDGAKDLFLIFNDKVKVNVKVNVVKANIKVNVVKVNIKVSVKVNVVNAIVSNAQAVGPPSMCAVAGVLQGSSANRRSTACGLPSTTFKRNLTCEPVAKSRALRG